MIKISVIICCLLSSIGFGQSFASAAGLPGSSAIAMDSSVIISWATGIEVTRGYLNSSNQGLGFASFGLPSAGLGVAEGDGVSIVSLGDGGIATVTFDLPITNQTGPDFAVFENGFADDYMEFAHVEVSSDGVNFVRFQSTSETPLASQIDNFSFGDCRYINNLAGKYRQGFGTPFDLEELSAVPLLNIFAITHVRLIDVVGSVNPSFGTTDGFGNLINDPFPTEFDSGGFDLDAIAVLHEAPLGIETDILNVKLFPNPTTNLLHIQIEGSGIVRVYTLLGQQILEKTISQEEIVNLKEFNQHFLFIEIEQQNKVYRQRICVNLGL